MKKLLAIAIVLIAGCSSVTFQQRPSKCCPEPIVCPVGDEAVEHFSAVPIKIKREVPPYDRVYTDGEIVVIDKEVYYVWPDGHMEKIEK